MRFLKEGLCTGRGGEIYIYYIIYKFPLPACAHALVAASEDSSSLQNNRLAVKKIMCSIILGWSQLSFDSCDKTCMRHCHTHRLKHTQKQVLRQCLRQCLKHCKELPVNAFDITFDIVYLDLLGI
jgi:hypothetical protein